MYPKPQKLLKKQISISMLFILSGCATTSPSHPTAYVLPTWTPLPTKNISVSTITPQPGDFSQAVNETEIPLPSEGYLYHGVYPGGNETDDVTYQALVEYETTVGKQATWVYFSTYWFESREFPENISSWIRKAGSIPYIRLMLQSKFKFDGNEPVYTLHNILAGQFDKDLQAWCAEARKFGTPLLVEYGTEVNTDSFPWSGIVNGAGTLDEYGDPTLPDGPERFKYAYQHIIQICRDEGADNITWVFHPSGESYPDDPWNEFQYYYPGDDWIDWIGVSIYGTHTPMDTFYGIFRADMESVHRRIIKLAPDKPIIVAEFGTAKNNPTVDQARWTRDALIDITSMRYRNLIGFSWWNEKWQNDGNPAHDTTMRVQDNSEIEVLFKEMVGNNPAVIGEILP